MRYLSPPRPLSYDSWGAWAAPLLGRAMRRLRREFPFDLVHAHYAVPAGDAVRRAAGSAPLVVSVHGHDVQGAGAGGPAVATTLRHARLVLANSAGTARRCAALGARDSRVVHLGADVPPTRAAPSERPTLVTVGHLAARKRHADVISALALLRDRHPQLRYVIVGDGPERERLAEHARVAGRRRPGGVSRPAAQRRGHRRRAYRRAVRDAERRRGVRRRVHRGDGGRGSGDRLPRRGRPRGDRRRRRRDRAGARSRRASAGRTHRRAALRPARARGARRRRHEKRSSASSRGSAAGRRRWPRTSTCSGALECPPASPTPSTTCSTV